MENGDYLKGRLLLETEIVPAARGIVRDTSVKCLPAMAEMANQVQCTRCGSVHLKRQAVIVNQLAAFYYCPSCIQLGRIQSNLALYHLPETGFPPSKVTCFWQGRLSHEQNRISEKLVQAVHDGGKYLVHAVTGAGKTEMLFAAIAAALSLGKRLCLASPRVDVCLELYPRLQAAFPQQTICLLYGKQPAPYQRTAFVLCTTHQLLRFYRAFDVLILDEADAYPYAGNAMLEHGCAQAINERNTLVFLTATPTKKMQLAVTDKRLSVSRLPARYHRYPLPEPVCRWVWQLPQQILSGKLPKALIANVAQRQRQTLMFCPSIRQTELLSALLKRSFPTLRIDSVHADDDERERKVAAMREGAYDILISTTILERGVTFPNIDVLVVGSDHRVFSESVLVQIAGRAGRSREHPEGDVVFLHSGMSREMKKALRHIRSMNCRAAERGLLG